MEITERKDIDQSILPGRALQRAVGSGSAMASEEMSVCYATYCAEYGSMDPHRHAEETIVVIASDGGSVAWGSDRRGLDHRAALGAGDVLHIPEGEWHAFRFKEGGSLDVICIYGKTDDLRPEDRK